jgi:hypothetical protein
MNFTTGLPTKIQVGDVIISASTNDLQVPIQNFLNSQWTGVSIVISGVNNDRVTLLESTQIPICEDIISGRMISGVGIVDLEQKLQRYQGQLFHRSLDPPIDRDRLTLLTQFVNLTWGKPFHDSPYYLARAFHRRNTQQVSTDTFFCAELVAAAYQHLGILIPPPYGRGASNYLPSDFSQDQELLDLDREYLFMPQHSIALPAWRGQF